MSGQQILLGIADIYDFLFFVSVFLNYIVFMQQI